MPDSDPGYKVPGLPHRTGHGIGLDVHEWTYIVRGNKTPIQPGLCFSIEPTVVIYGEFGMLEDVAYSTPQGPKFFNNQSLQPKSHSLDASPRCRRLRTYQSAALLNCLETARFWVFSHNESPKDKRSAK